MAPWPFSDKEVNASGRPSSTVSPSSSSRVRQDPAPVDGFRLLRSLGDDEPEVVIAALDALEFAGDETLVPDLEPLLEHPDERVREAAAEAIDFLQ